MLDNALIQLLAREGAMRALRVCLSLESGDSLVLFFDEGTKAAADVFLEVARDIGLNVLERFVPRHTQQNCDGRLSNTDQEALEGARAVLVCVSAGREGLTYRKALANAAVDPGRYVGLIPGAMLSVLAQGVNIDYDKVKAKCEDLALALLMGHNAVLTSYELDRRGGATPHTLRMKLGGIDRSPITSTGIIPRGTWGNLPGGETFIAPIEGSAEGTFVLNGAFTGQVLDPEHPIVLSFNYGLVSDITGRPDELAPLNRVLGRGSALAEAVGLAELGIGVNDGIIKLTGNALLDEKKAGTIHIALGDNSIYGGLLQSSLHEDLVTVRPSLTIDGKSIVDRGEFVLEALDWRESVTHARMLGASKADDFLIRRTLTHDAGPDASSRLRVNRQVGAHRQCSYTIGSNEIARDLAAVYSLLPPMPEEIWFSLVEKNWCLTGLPRDSALLKGMIAILEKHELVRLQYGTED